MLKVFEKFVNPKANISLRMAQKQDDTNEIEFLMQKISFILNESIFKLTATFGISLKFEPSYIL
jgi:hypothetical protein